MQTPYSGLVTSRSLKPLESRNAIHATPPLYMTKGRFDPYLSVSYLCPFKHSLCQKKIMFTWSYIIPLMQSSVLGE